MKKLAFCLLIGVPVITISMNMIEESSEKNIFEHELRDMDDLIMEDEGGLYSCLRLFTYNQYVDCIVIAQDMDCIAMKHNSQQWEKRINYYQLGQRINEIMEIIIQLNRQ